MTMVQLTKPKDSHFTDKQWQAVCDEGTNILISASAGSGKTTVLVERVIQKIKAGVNVDELLIVTYTEAAAKEMKQRIQVAVQKTINEDDLTQGEMQHFVRQLSLLPTAHISTLHAFCLQVIRKYYYLIDIDPVFRLLTDETENLLLKEDVWDKLREDLFAERQESFYRLAENFSNDRNDNGLTYLIFSLHQFAMANPEPLVWLDSLSEMYAVEGKTLSDLELYQHYFKPDLLGSLYQMTDSLAAQLSLIEGEPDFEKTVPILQNEVALLRELVRLLEVDELDAFYQALHGFQFDRIKGPTKKNSTEDIMEIYEDVKAVRDSVKKQLTKFAKTHFSLSPDEMIQLMDDSYPLMEEMVIVTKQFLVAFRAEKEKKNVVDFNDLEHLTLNILRRFTAGEWEASIASDYYRGKFSEVLVDEYQDINRLQENILYWLRQPATNEGNLFMVGDVKQSIYAFRLADPTLFIEKYEQYKTEDDGRRIILAENFRSRQTVLDFTNLVFEQLMDEKLGQIAYDESAQLVAGYQDYPESAEHQTEIMIYESQTDDQGEAEYDENIDFVIDDKTQGELLLVGKKIKELVAKEFPLYDKKSGQNRAIQYSDIVLLTPTKKNNLVILDVFKELDIPLAINDTQNYFQATEIRIMVALLQVIDNPYQDIPLVSVLRSPIVGLKENDLVRIREFAPQDYYYDALEAFVTKETQVDACFEKVKNFYTQFNRWRELARREELVRLIWTIYEETDLLDYVSGMPSGKQRQANLHALYERAEAYEEMSFKGLFQFVRLIEKMQAKDKDLAEPVSEVVENAVRVMTIHASKGLEFPVVFVLDLAKQFNLQDIRTNPYIFDESLGAGIKYLDEETRVKSETLPFIIIREAKRKKMLAEEMRKLYVAFTRAEQKLFLVGSYKSRAKAFEKWQTNLTSSKTELPVATKLSHQSLMGWIGMTLMRVPDIQKAFPEIEVDPILSLEKWQAPISLNFFDEAAVLAMDAFEAESPQTMSEIKVSLDPNVALLKEVTDVLSFEYPYDQATKTTSYQSVSEIKRMFEDPDTQKLEWLDLTKQVRTSGYRYVEEEFATPKFMTGKTGVLPTEIGSATHLMMQLISFDKTPTAADFISLRDELVTKGLIEEKVAARVSIDQLVQFIESDFGQDLVMHASSLKREQPFSLLMHASEIFKDYPEKSDDQLLVHGIIDGYFETDQGLVLYDFKTDFVKDPNDEANLSVIKQRYLGQLNLYKIALQNATKQDVVQTKLVLLNTNTILDV
ncbi:helicase-exonuclease AddAB subunit AddA [Vagococcus silagei]|uniref:ATP-dependent helicase/nuclease subunit A n=1 Tax=Vagococcus silagei TaxID=2508885 RepID=A0A4S3B4M8_9ENTE|nr:helicase-exonuclease AddAB subunit AddA [Vagococcus silagei]